MAPENGWAEYKKLVEYRLDQADEQHAEVMGRLDDLQSSIKSFEGKIKGFSLAWTTMWAVLFAAAALIPTLGGCGG